MKASVKVTISTGDPSLANALYSSLKPDNVDFPPGLSIVMRRSGGSLTITFRAPDVTDTLISTVDDVFEACGVSLLGIRSSEGN
ncbi:MAG TPA: KEOPS complex subunit Pcc1 [Conexivisphaerales archaeon]|nr:KEOPS complex subunit Pcc1 [Conexivisphaerales archaeon]